MFDTGLDYEIYEMEYEEVLAFEDNECEDFPDDYWWDDMGYDPYTGCYDFDC